MRAGGGGGPLVVVSLWLAEPLLHHLLGELPRLGRALTHLPPDLLRPRPRLRLRLRLRLSVVTRVRVKVRVQV